MPVLVLVQVPPAAVSFRALVPNPHIWVLPVIVPASGSAVTVTCALSLMLPQLLVNAKCSIVLPALCPVTIPVADTDAIDGEPVPQMPPEPVSENVVAIPGHMFAGPFMTPETGSTVTVTTVKVSALPQVLPTWYFIVSVPKPVPVTRPDVFTVAMPVFTLLHTPPVAVSLKRLVVSPHNWLLPVITPACGCKVTTACVLSIAAPQLLLVE